MKTHPLKSLIALEVQAMKTEEEKSALINGIIKSAVAEGIKAGIMDWFHYLPDGFALTPGGVEGFEEAEALRHAYVMGMEEVFLTLRPAM